MKKEDKPGIKGKSFKITIDENWIHVKQRGFQILAPQRIIEYDTSNCTEEEKKEFRRVMELTDEEFMNEFIEVFKPIGKKKKK